MSQLTRLDAQALNRALLGFDNFFTDFENRFGSQVNNNYPPYNILKHGEDTYQLEIAVTGFDKSEITVEIDQDQLVVKGERKAVEDAETEYLHRGLAARSFTRSWTLAEHMIVGEGRIKNGVLTIELTREVPEALKPRVLKLKGE